MKTSTFIAVLLTFLTLLLVMSAAAFFLWQDWQDLQVEVVQLEGRTQELDVSLGTAHARAAGRELALATAQAVQADLGTRAAQAVATQEALLAEQSEMGTRLFTLEAEQANTGSPFVQIVFPGEGEDVTQGTVNIIAMAAHPTGIADAQIVIDGQKVQLEADNAPYRALRYQIPPSLAPGLHTITATITSTNNLTASDAVTFTIVSPTPASSPDELP